MAIKEHSPAEIVFNNFFCEDEKRLLGVSTGDKKTISTKKTAYAGIKALTNDVGIYVYKIITTK